MRLSDAIHFLLDLRMSFVANFWLGLELICIKMIFVHMARTVYISSRPVRKYLGPILVALYIFNPSMDKWLHPL